MYNQWCCYITVDSAMAASQNGFCSYSIHKKTNIMQIMSKNVTIFIYLIYYHREMVKLDHFMTLFLSYANTVLWRSRCKIHRFLAVRNQHPEFYILYQHHRILAFQQFRQADRYTDRQAFRHTNRDGARYQQLLNSWEVRTNISKPEQKMLSRSTDWQMYRQLVIHREKTYT